MKPVIFVDRDGVIIKDRPDYITATNQIRYIPHAITALRVLSQLDAHIFIITNQSAVGKKVITRKKAQIINRFILEDIRESGARVDGLYFCSHSPNTRCNCRKPKTGMIFQAYEEHEIPRANPDFDRFLIGDHWTDLACAAMAGIKPIFVTSGRGNDILRVPRGIEWKYPQIAVRCFPDLLDAVIYIVKWVNERKGDMQLSSSQLP